MKGPRAPRPAAGVAICILSGLLSSCSGTLMRLLSESAGPHRATPSMLLSYLMVVMLAVNVLVAGAASLVAGSMMSESQEEEAWSWTRLVWPSDGTDWALVFTNCACTLGGHLATAAGYQTTRAGIVAFLQLTEIPWVYGLDVWLLGEPTTLSKSIGSAVVFGSAVAVACLRAKPPT